MKSIFEPADPISTLKNDSIEYIALNSERLIQDQASRPRLPQLIFALALLTAGFFLGGRLLKLQIAEGSIHQLLAEGNRIRATVIPAPRGIIFDRAGKDLVVNLAGYQVQLIPSDLPRDPKQRENIFEKVTRMFSLDKNNFEKKVIQEGLYSVDPIILEDNISHDRALQLQIQLNGLTGVKVTSKPQRNYINLAGFSQVIGYIGKISPSELTKFPDYRIDSEIGKTGVEQEYDSWLRGVAGQERIEVNAQGQLEKIIATIDPVQGDNVQLTLDSEFQKVTADNLQKAISDNKAKAGSAIALDPRDGSILSLVSLPDYDNNAFIQQDQTKITDFFKDQNYPLLNRAIAGTYPSGSSLKPVVASVGLQDGVITPTLQINTPAEIRIGSFSFPDWKVHGVTDVRKAIAESNNIFFYAVGGGWDKISGLGVDRLSAGLRMFDLGDYSGIDLPGEARGLVPDPTWKKKVLNQDWYIGDTYHLAIGQGDILVTPLQLIRAIAATGNGGNLVVPHVVEKITSQTGKVVYQPKLNSKKVDVSSANLQVVKEGMEKAVQPGGSANTLGLIKRKDGSEVKIAAKTGTAQFDTGTDSTHSWFVCYAPADNPEIAIIVMVENGGEGWKVALPVAREMLKNWFGR